jgi:hypothetical protein
LLNEFEQPEIETGIVDQYDHIRIEGEYVFFAKFDIAEYSRQVFDHLYKAHEGQVAYMPHYGATGSSHLITAPAAYVSSSVALAQCLDKVGTVQVTRCLAGYDVILQMEIRLKVKIIRTSF